MAVKNNKTPWSYRKGATLLHRLPAGLKLIFLLFFSIAAFLPGSDLQSFIILAIEIFLIALLSVIARIGPIALLHGSRPLFFTVIAVFIFRGIEISPLFFNPRGIREGALLCTRLLAAFSAGSLFFAVTTSGEIKKSLVRLESALRIERLKLGLSISLMLGFLPRFFVIWEDINLAWKSRGGKNNLRRLIVLVPLVVEKMMLHAADTAEAMEARSTVG